MIFALGYRETAAIINLYSQQHDLGRMLIFPVGKAFLIENKKEWTNNNQLLMLIIEIMVLNQLTYMHRI